MSYWLALYCPLSAAPPTEHDGTGEGATGPGSQPIHEPGTPSTEALALGGWALQFTPRVALLEDAVVLEVQASLKLFKGAASLRRRLRDARQLGCQRMAWAPTSLAALALARALQPNGFGEALPQLLDRLPLTVLTEVAEHQPMLSRLGCQTLGDVRALPRNGLSRRFGKALLEAMDRAYGLLPESHVWLQLPEAFEARLELPGRVESAEAMMFAAQRLLLQMGGWLTARHSGVCSFVLSWQHDFHRRAAGPGGELVVRTSHATRNIDHLRRLLSEQLDRITLAAPVGALALRADEVEPLAETSGGLWPQRELQGGAEAAAMSAVKHDELLERLSARLGAERVLRPVLHADHRAEAMQSWQPAATIRVADKSRRDVAFVPSAARPRASTSPQPGRGEASGTASLSVSGSRSGSGSTSASQTSPVIKPARASAAPPLLRASPTPVQPQPSWVLPEPLPLSTHRERPIYRGPLQFIAGPQRLEVGWWHQAAAGAVPASTLQVQRDYYVAHSARAGLLWIYCERPGLGLSGEPTPWFLHGIFA